MSEELLREAVAFARANPVCHLATVEGDAPRLRVMQAARIDDDLMIWFACGASSSKVRQIEANPHVQVAFWASPQDLVVSGTAEIVEDVATKHELWEADWRRFFAKGKDDPDYCLLRVAPPEALYRHMEHTGLMPESLL